MLYSGIKLDQSDIELSLIYTYKKLKKSLSEGLLKGLTKKASEEFVSSIENTALLIKNNLLEDFKEVYNYEL